MSSGERPIGAAKGKQPNTEALCHPPPPPLNGTNAQKQHRCNDSIPCNHPTCGWLNLALVCTTWVELM